jgi:hypothetical protein
MLVHKICGAEECKAVAAVSLSYSWVGFTGRHGPSHNMCVHSEELLMQGAQFPSMSGRVRSVEWMDVCGDVGAMTAHAVHRRYENFTALAAVLPVRRFDSRVHPQCDKVRPQEQLENAHYRIPCAVFCRVPLRDFPVMWMLVFFSPAPVVVRWGRC